MPTGRKTKHGTTISDTKGTLSLIKLYGVGILVMEVIKSPSPPPTQRESDPQPTTDSERIQEIAALQKRLVELTRLPESQIMDALNKDDLYESPHGISPTLLRT